MQLQGSDPAMRHAQLRAFHHVAISGGFSRAAAMLGLTQPAISDHVKKLEREHDVLLFHRGGKQVSLTGEGARLLEITRRLFDAETSALDLLAESRAARAGRLRIFADSPHHILHVLGRFRTAHRDVPVTVRTGNSAEILRGLRHYEVDIGILGEVPVDRAFDVVALGTTPLVAFARRGGPLDRRRTVRLDQLVRLPLVLREDGSKTRAKLEQLALEAGHRVRASIEAEGREAVRTIVAAGGGVGVVSEAEFAADPRLTKARITDPAIAMDEALICLRERADNPLIRTFMAMARQAGTGG